MITLKIYDIVLKIDTGNKLKQVDITKGRWFIENTFKDRNDWHLTNSMKEGSYFVEVKTIFDIIKVLEHVGDKIWVDRARLLEGLMPAIRFLSYRRP